MIEPRQNVFEGASIERIHRYKSGAFEYVWKAKYTNGIRSGQVCVFKYFESGSAYEEYYFAREMKVIEQCQNTLDAWTKSGVQSPFSITMNVPEIWTCAKGVTNAIIEPFIPNFTKFNSNSGWILDTDSERGHILQALSHFSYHISGGQLLLCDLQGGFERDRHCLVCILSDPVIMSRGQKYGPSDLGKDGIRCFFSRHKCSRFCKSSWVLPKQPTPPVIASKRGTSMA